MALLDTTQNFLNPEQRPLQQINSTILDVHTSDNIASYIDPSDQYVIKEALLTNRMQMKAPLNRTDQSLLFKTNPIYISEG